MERKRTVSLMRAVCTNDGSVITLLDDTSPAAWRDILRQLQVLEIAPLFFSHLTRTAATAHVPVEVLQQLRKAYFLHAARNTIILKDLKAIIRILTQQGIGAIILKGACLAATVYDDIALRPMHDIDILIREKDLCNAQTVLLGMGYGPAMRPPVAEQILQHHHLIPFTRPGSPPVEVHATLTPPGGPCAMAMDGFWDRARTADFDGLTALTLSPEDLLLHLCLHFSANHRFSILEMRNLCDISETIKRHHSEIDWKTLGDRAHAYGVGRYVFCTLRVAALLFGAPLGPEALCCTGDEDSGIRTADRLADLLLDETSVPLPDALEQMDSEHGLAPKVRVLARSLLPPPDCLAGKYGIEEKSARRSLYLRYWMESVMRAGKFLTQLLFGNRRAWATVRRRKTAILINTWLRSGSSSRAS